MESKCKYSRNYYGLNASVKSNFEHICAGVVEDEEPDICEFENMVLEQLQQFIKNIGRFETLSRTPL